MSGMNGAGANGGIDYRMLEWTREGTRQPTAHRRAMVDATTPRMELVVIAPRLMSLPAPTLQSSAALARIASWATHTPVAQGLDAALLAASGIKDASIAALVARGGGIDPAAGHWLVADPVTLVAGRDDVVVAARAGHLDPAFVARAIAILNAHFAVDSLSFVAARPDRWLLRLADAAPATFVPTDVALGGSVYAHRPQGRDARRFERYANEVQMLLHDAPENDAREREALQPFNGLWFWGNDAVQAAQSPVVRVEAHATAGAEGDLARGIALASGGNVHELGDRLTLAADRSAAVTLVALPVATADTFAQFDAAWLLPVEAALAGHAVTRLTLIADGNGAHQWTAKAPTSLQRLRTHFAKPRFAVPP